MSGQLLTSGDGGGFEHCAVCGALAAGPCARCRKPLCGDCCIITSHGATQWAICRRCEQKGGSSLRSAWIGLALWLGVPIVVLAVLVALFLAATLVLAWVNESMSWAQAAYVALISELGGANPDPGVSGLERATLVVLTLVSIALIPALTAAVVDGVVKARLRLESGVLTEAIDGHLVVVGLGDVGTRVVRALTDAGLRTVAIEANPQARGVQVARDLGVPVIIGNASRVEVLRAASVRTCRALVVASTNDVTNLETALLGRSEKADLRVVVRIFDGEFADRVQRAFSIDVSRSVSYLAAPAFAAAMLGRQIIATIPVGRHVLLIAEVPVGAGSAVDHQPAGSVNRTHEVRLLAVRAGARDGAPPRDQQVVWQPSDSRRIEATDRRVVVANRAGFGDLLDDTTPPPPAAPPPADVPPATHPQPTSAPSRLAEGLATHPPFGPADGDSTRPA
jgi:Trk K+ transport system NAD-binding subunit